jgi:hypothetical protein
MTSKRFSSLIILLTIIFCSVRSYGSHMIGGDVTYRCLGSNSFEITITLFQDCLYGEPGALAQDNPAYYSIFDAKTNQLVMADSVTALSTQIVDPNFSNACINNYPNTCLRKQVFKFTRTLSPTKNGYVIVYERCCRNASINNIQSPGNVGVTYFATIPPFNSGQCPNNSAVFKNFPPQIICANNPLIYDFSATGKVLILHEDTLTGGLGGELSAWINEHCFEQLDAPVIRCAGLDTPIPFAIELEQNFMAKNRLDESIEKLVKY